MQICIHIGLPKTASTTLQSTLFPGHSEVEYLGRFIGTGSKYLDRDVEALLSEILAPPSRSRNLPKQKTLFQEKILPRIVSGKVILWSSEDITSGGPEHKQRRAEGFYEVFGPCRVVLVLRHPLSFAQSMYLQKLKETQERAQPGFGRAGQHYDVVWWLEQCFKLTHLGPISNLDYGASIDAFSQVFGRESLGIFIFEQLAENPEKFFRRLCSFMGIDGDEGVQLTANQKRNPQLTQKQLDFIKSTSSSPLRSFLYRLRSNKGRRRILHAEEYALDASKAKVQIPHVWRTRLEDLTRECNRTLVEEWEIPLDRYDYPL